MSDTKPCKKCQQNIGQAAQICPHCKMPQSFLAHIKLYIPFVIAFGVVILLINFITEWYNQKDEAVNQDCNQPSTQVAQFIPQQHDVLIKSSEFNFIKSEKNNQVVVMGMIENNTEAAWESLKFEVRFFDANGKMIDTFSSMKYDMAIQPNATASFRLIDVRAQPIDSYVSHQVKITDAHLVSEYY